MTRYMFDTNVCIDLIRGRDRTLAARIAALEPGQSLLSSISLAELQCGVAKCRTPETAIDALTEFCTAFDILSFDTSAAEVYGHIRAELENAGTPIGPLDTLIAAHALAADCTLVTNNENEFRRVRNLTIENWIDPQR